MTDGYESVGELGRAFDDFRAETRDELKWLRRWLIASLGTVVVASISSSVWAVLRS